MKHFSEFLQAQKNRDFEKASIHAKAVIAANYPESLRQVAKEFLEQARPVNQQFNNPSVGHLLSLLSSNKSYESYHDPSRWLPWRAIGDANDLGISEKNREFIIAEYEKNHALTGESAIRIWPVIDDQKVATAISPYFDCDFYRTTHPDMRGADDAMALTHYAVHGRKESSRCPNQVFRNSEFYGLYPWAKEIRANPLYVFVRWYEQFPEYGQILLSRCLALQTHPGGGTGDGPSFASIKTASQERSEYKRILHLVAEFSDAGKRLKPDPARLKIHVVIPDFTEGGGGHMTIFRMILHLEKAGHECTVWIKDYLPERHPFGPTRSATDHYQPIKARVLPLSSHFAFSSGDALIATSWDTVEIVKAHRAFHDYFYLVQDFEPYFFARGSEALQAEATYQSEIKTICASVWLDGLMRERYGRTSTFFNLSYNPQIYFPEDRPNSQAPEPGSSSDAVLPVIRIAFYARQRTARRAVTLALEGLALVKQDKFRLCVELFGEKKGEIQLPENIIGFDNGILSPKELADLYRSCDIGLTFSATNYALVPQEMMACGLPVIEIDNESTRAIYPDMILAFAEPSAGSIAAKIEALAVDPMLRQQYRNNALLWVRNTSWDKSFTQVATFIKDQVLKAAAGHEAIEDYSAFYRRCDHAPLVVSSVEQPKVTVVIPVYNGGPLLLEVIDQVLKQQIEGEFELIIIDSSSSDGHIELIPPNPRLSIYRIPKATFQHGRTRNLGVALARAPFVAFLTQDAIPNDDAWLAHLIRPLQQHPHVMGVFGRHKGHEDHPDFIKESMNNHFNSFLSQQLVSKHDNLASYYDPQPQHRQRLHYYSDNNSCLRKAAWLQFPYHDVFYGEDQLWADWLIQWGHTKAYADRAVVRHSHFYTNREEFERSSTEAYFFKMFFGYDLSQDRITLEHGVETEAKRILENDDLMVAPHKTYLLTMLRAKVEGYQQGVAQVNAEIKQRFGSLG